MIPAVYLVGCGDEKAESIYEGTSYNSPSSSQPVDVEKLLVGAVRANNGSYCTEYRISGPAVLDRLSSVKGDLRQQAASQNSTFQETACSTKNAFGNCKKEMSGNGGTVHMSVYFFAPATEKMAQDSCDAVAGSYTSLN